MQLNYKNCQFYNFLAAADQAKKLDVEQAAKLAADQAKKLAAEQAAKLAADQATKLAAEQAAKLAADQATKLAADQAKKLEQDKLEANKKGKFQSCPTYSVNSTFSR
jgi:hypothetical protein